jgi:hypothetical protein
MTDVFGRKMFSATKHERIKVNVDDGVRTLIGSLSDQLREMLLVDDADDLRRLYPTAYPDDAERQAGFHDMVHDQLLMARLDGIDRVEATLHDDELSIDDADAWLSTINQIRLVLGTRLDVSEDDDPVIDEDDPRAAAQVIYQVMSHVLEDLTGARTELL